MTNELSRRDVIGGALAASAGAAAASTLGPVAAQAKPKPKPYSERNRVDMHGHYLTAEYVDALHANGILLLGGLPIPEWSPDIALEFMGKYGIRFQMLSVSDPAVTFVPADEAKTLARSCNEYVAGVVRERPSRFGALSVLPMPDVDAARAEVAYCLDTLGHDGVGLLSSYGGRYLGDATFEPLLADLNARGAWVMVHPGAPLPEDRPEYSLPIFVAEYPFDTTRTILSLMFNAVFKRYPKIRWHFAHGGGTAPMLRFRLKTLADNAAQFGALIGLPPHAQELVKADAAIGLRDSFYDTALIADGPSLEAVAHMTEPSHILFGSDYPFAGRLYQGEGDPQPGLSRVFNAKTRHGIDRLNGRAQFPRLRKAVPGT